jgi:hypothetical protein
MAAPTTPPDALLLITGSCPHCPSVLASLGTLLKAGRIGRLEAINIETRPDVAGELGVRTVPWLRLGSFELEGLHSFAELQHWAETAGTRGGTAAYLANLLKTGRLAQATSFLQREPGWLPALLDLLRDPAVDLHVRVGVSALAEAFTGAAALAALVPELGELLRHHDAHVRGDAVHILALSRDAAALPWLRIALDDESPQVRELAADALATNGSST